MVIELIEKRQQNSKTFKLDNGRKQLVVSIGAVHYKDNKGKWQDIAEGYSEPDTVPFNKKYPHLPYHLRLADDSTRRIYPDRNDQSYWLEFGKILPDMGLPEKVKVEAYRWKLGTYDLQIIIDGARVKLNITLKTPAAPTSFTIPLTLNGLTRDGLLFKHNGEVTGLIRKPMATDAEGNIREVDIIFEAGKIILNLDTTGLVYPIQIDPTWQVGASTDDCVRRLGDDWWLITYVWELAGGHTYTWDCQSGVGMRFTNVTIPQGSTIDQAYLTLRCSYSDFTGANCRTRISAEDVDDAPTFADDKAAFDARWAARTTARVDWDNIPTWTLDNDYDSPEIKAVIKEIVDRGDWASGNDIVIFWEDFEDRSTHAPGNRRAAHSYDGSATYAPKLVVTFTPPGWSGKISGVTNPAKVMGVDVANIKSVKGVQ